MKWLKSWLCGFCPKPESAPEPEIIPGPVQYVTDPEVEQNVTDLEQDVDDLLQTMTNLVKAGVLTIEELKSKLSPKQQLMLEYYQDRK
jgi:hypothetical protein